MIKKVIDHSDRYLLEDSIVYRGKRFTSKKELINYTGLNTTTVYRRMNSKGVDVVTAIDQLLAEQQPRSAYELYKGPVAGKSTPLIYKNVTYNSITELYSVLKINRKYVTELMKRTGCSIGEAIDDYLSKDRTRFTYRGYTYESLLQAMKILNLSYTHYFHLTGNTVKEKLDKAILTRINKLGHDYKSIEEFYEDQQVTDKTLPTFMQSLSANEGKTFKSAITYNGISYPSLGKLLSAVGIHVNKYKQVAASNPTWTIEQVINSMLSSYINKTVEYGGKIFDNLSAVCKYYNIDSDNVRYYINRHNRSIEDSVSLVLVNQMTNFLKNRSISDIIKMYNLPDRLRSTIKASDKLTDIPYVIVDWLQNHERRDRLTKIWYRGKFYKTIQELVDDVGTTRPTYCKIKLINNLNTIQAIDYIVSALDKKKITYNGTVYNNLSDLCKQLNLSSAAVHYLCRKQNLPIIDAVDSLVKTNNMIYLSRIIEYRGNQYRSLLKACQDLQISYSSVCHYISKFPTIEQAIDKTILNKLSYIYHEFDNINQVLYYFKIKGNELPKLMKKFMEDEGRFSFSRKHSTQTVTYLGRSFSSMSRLCSILGLSYESISRRVKEKGMTLKDAITETLKFSLLRPYRYAGKLYPSYTDAAAALKIKCPTLLDIVHYGVKHAITKNIKTYITEQLTAGTSLDEILELYDISDSQLIGVLYNIDNVNDVIELICDYLENKNS